MVRKLARLTGLSTDYIERTNMRVEIERFTKELMRSERRTVGRIDGRFTGIDRDAAGESPEYDPSIAAIIGPYTATLNDYVRGDLKFDSDLPYEVLTGRVYPWSYKPYENRYVDVGETLPQRDDAESVSSRFCGEGLLRFGHAIFSRRTTRSSILASILP